MYIKQLLHSCFLFFFLSSAPFAQTFTLSDKIFKAGDIYVEEHIYFDRGDWKLRPESNAALEKITFFLLNNKHLTIEVGVHTDTRSSYDVSYLPTQKRAESIIDYLVSKGVHKNKLIAKSYGETTPRIIRADVSFMKKGDVITDAYISKLKTQDQKEEAHQMNRRVELKILKAEPRYFKLTDTVFNLDDVYIADKIHFDYNLNTLRDESAKQLDSIVYLMNKNPALVIEIGGHTDSHGTDDYNMELSRMRAQAVVKYLVKKGIRKKRLTAVGYGETKPLALNEQPDGTDNPQGRQLNRRIELKILKTD